MSDPNPDEEIDRLLRALSDGTRRRLLDRLRDAPGLTLSELTEGFTQTRQALSKHLSMLESAELVVAVWRGREKLHYLNPVPIAEIANRWIRKFERHRVDALVDLKRKLESE